MLPDTAILHIEPTTACNAACPQCAREIDKEFNKELPVHLTLPQLLAVFDNSKIKKLTKMFMCGTYGDPAAGNNTLSIFKYFKEINPTITLGINTNGSLRTEQWWKELASIMSLPTDYAVFSIDGLYDTNHIYRVNTNWDKIIKNATAFISAGGNAHWDMLIFKHNEHQVEEAKELAKQLGFKWFRAKVSKRFDSMPIAFLSPPVNYSPAPPIPQQQIDCQMLRESSLYLSAEGKLYPCCHLGVTGFTLDQFNSIRQSWSSDSPNPICISACTVTSTSTIFKNQWVREIEL